MMARGYDVELIGSSFGGGWAFGLSDAGTLALKTITGDDAAPLAPHGGREGWVVEPQDFAELLAMLADDGLAIRP